MGKVKTLITNGQNKVKIPSGIRMLIRRCCNSALQLENIDNQAEVSVTFVDNEKIRQLNKKYRNIDSETDVLSFPLYESNTVKDSKDEVIVLGDIVISVEKAYEQAEIYGHSIQRELGFLTVHSMFHLLGYDHEDGGLKAVQMREKEESVLSKLGISRWESYVLKEE